MKNLKSYKMFLEAKEEPYENIMKDMADEGEIDANKMENTKKETENIKDTLVKKKEDLEKKLDNLENLEVDTFSEPNKEIVIKKKELIAKAIEELNTEIAEYEKTVGTFKENIDKLKK